MTRPLLACLIISLWLLCLAPTMPTQVQAPTPIVQTNTAKAVHAPPASVDLGPSVSLSYTFPALLADTAASYSWGYMGTSVDGGSMTDSHLTALNTLPFAYYFYYYDAAGSYNWVAMDVVTVFEGLTGVGTYNTQHDLQVCYSGITTFTWNITTWFYDISTNAWVQQDCHVGTPAGPGGTYTLLDTPSLTYTTSYIDATGDFRVKVRGWAQISAAGGGFILGNRMRMNQPRTTRTAMAETRRSQFAIQGGTMLYTLTFMAPESMTTITGTYPTAWDWQSLQPSANVAETSGQVVITNTDQDTVYAASFTAPVLATANWQDAFSDSFESGYGRWTHYWGATVTLSLDYVTVADGAASLKAVFPASNTGVELTAPDAPLASGDYWVVFSLYATSAIPILFYRDSSDVWGYTTHTTTANAWTTFVVPCPAWSLRATGNIAFLFYHGTSAATVWLDGFRVYNSSVSAGSTITGTCRHIHPNGDLAADFTNVSVGLWDASYAWKAYGSAVTDAEGAWSVAASSLYGSLSAQTYKLWTWVYAGANAYWALDAATDATTDWSETYGASSTVTTSTDCKEGAASIYNQAKFDSDDWIRLMYNPTGTWSLTNTLLTGWAKVNSTTNVLYALLELYTDATHYANYRLKYSSLYYYGFTANAWTRVTVPVSTTYLSYSEGLNLAAVDSCGVWLYNQTNPNTAGYGTRVDSLNFLTRYTSNTLTYPFTTGPTTTMTFCFRQADATPIAWPTPWKIYVQNSRLGGVLQYTTTLLRVNLTVVDLWGGIVYQNLSLVVGAFVDITMPIYTLTMNNRRDYPQDLKITHSSVDFWIYGIGADCGVPYLILNGVYTICWYKQGEYTNPTDPAYTFTVTSAPVSVSSGEDLPPTGGGGNENNYYVPDFWQMMVVVVIAGGLSIIAVMGGVGVHERSTTRRRRATPEETSAPPGLPPHRPQTPATRPPSTPKAAVTPAPPLTRSQLIAREAHQRQQAHRAQNQAEIKRQRDRRQAFLRQQQGGRE